jgi:hypothetical protein
MLIGTARCFSLKIIIGAARLVSDKKDWRLVEWRCVATLQKTAVMRTLTKRQRDAIAKELLPFAKNERLVRIVCGVDDDVEVTRFCFTLQLTLQDAGLNAHFMHRDFIRTFALHGVYVIATPDEESQRLCAAIADALKREIGDAPYFPSSATNPPDWLREYFPAGWYEHPGRSVAVVVMQRPPLELPESEDDPLF